MNLEKKVEITANEYADALKKTIGKKYEEYKTLAESLLILQDKIQKGYIIKYYGDGDNLWYSSEEKRHIGYRRKLGTTD